MDITKHITKMHYLCTSQLQFKRANNKNTIHVFLKYKNQKQNNDSIRTITTQFTECERHSANKHSAHKSCVISKACTSLFLSPMCSWALLRDQQVLTPVGGT